MRYNAGLDICAASARSLIVARLNPYLMKTSRAAVSTCSSLLCVIATPLYTSRVKPVQEQGEACGVTVPDRLTHSYFIILTNIVKPSTIDNMTTIVSMTKNRSAECEERHHG